MDQNTPEQHQHDSSCNEKAKSSLFVDFIKVWTPWILAGVSLVVFALKGNYVTREDLSKNLNGYVRKELYDQYVEYEKLQLEEIRKQNDRIIQQINAVQLHQMNNP